MIGVAYTTRPMEEPANSVTVGGKIETETVCEMAVTGAA
jgi:hypothetical protein